MTISQERLNKLHDKINSSTMSYDDWRLRIMVRIYEYFEVQQHMLDKKYS